MDDWRLATSHRWVSPKTEPRPSKIYGIGIFAREPIQGSETVAIFGGAIVPKSEIENYWREMGHVGIQVNDEFFIVPLTKQEVQQMGVFNHSCNPNVGFAKSIALVAIRDIQPGEELAFDYAFNETFFEPFICNCGFGNCRKKIRPDDWKRHEIRSKYGQYYSPYLRNRTI